MSKQQKPDWITDQQWKAVPSVEWWEDARVKMQSIAQRKPLTPEGAKALFARLKSEKNWKVEG
jgi:hypothetical protein